MLIFLIILIICLWCFSGIYGAINDWLLDFDMTTNNLICAVMCGIGMGPVILLIYLGRIKISKKNNFDKVIIKKKGSRI